MSDRRLHVALIAREFPPSLAIAARRALRFARGLSDCGLRVSVISTQSRFYGRLDSSAPETDEQAFRVLRTSTAAPVAGVLGRRAGTGNWGLPRAAAGARGEPGSAPSLKRRVAAVAGAIVRAPMRPDEDLGWVPYVVGAASRLHRENPIDVVLPSGPPYSSFLAGELISRRTGAALVLDYRDPWAANRIENRGLGAVGRGVEAWLERRVLRRSRLTLFTSPSAQSFYREHYGRLLGRNEVLLNGVDEYLPAGPAPPDRPPLVWTHAGTLHSGRRSLAPLLRAMAKLPADMPCKLVLIGPEPHNELSLAASLGIEGQVDWVGLQPVQKTLEYCQHSHRLVAVVAAAHPYSIPAKIFDYMRTSRPMLLLSDPEHAAAAIVRGVPGHSAVANDDEAAIEELLRQDHRRLREEKGIPGVDREASRPYEGAQQVRRLARWIEEVAAAQP